MASPGLPCERRMAVGQWMMTYLPQDPDDDLFDADAGDDDVSPENWPADHDPPPDDRELGVPDRLMTMRTLGATASSVLGGGRHVQ